MKFTLTILGAVLLSAGMALAANDAKPTYPLTTCVVSGEKLGGMGDPYIFTFEGKEVRLCCSGCKDAFQQNSAAYLKKIQDAQKAN